MEKCVYYNNFYIKNILSYIKTMPHLIEYLVNFKDSKSFIYNTDKELREIHNLFIEDGYDSYTFAICLRDCQNILRQEIKEKGTHNKPINMIYDNIYNKMENKTYNSITEYFYY